MGSYRLRHDALQGLLSLCFVAVGIVDFPILVTSVVLRHKSLLQVNETSDLAPSKTAYGELLDGKLKRYIKGNRTQNGYTFADLEKATQKRDEWGAFVSLPELGKLKALDKDGDGMVSREEVWQFKGLESSYCRYLGEGFGCAERCTSGQDDFDGNFGYLADKGVATFEFSKEVEKYKTISDSHPAGAVSLAQKRAIALALAQVVHDRIEGATCEFGVFEGRTSAFLHNMLKDLQASDTHPLHLFDSFEGLPDCDKKKDTGMCGGGRGIMARSQSIVRNFLEGQGIPVPPMHKGYFSDIPDSEFPQKIAFAFIDGDLYPSMFSALERVWPRLSEGGIVMLHDYAWEGYPGTETAAQDFLKNHTEKVQLVGSSNGVACTIGLLRKEAP